MNKFKQVAAAVVATVALMGTAACTGQEANVNAGEVKSGTNAQTQAPTKEAPSEEPKDTGILSFGEQAVFDDGLAVTVSEPKAFKPGRWAVGGERFDNHVIFTVTIVNDTDVIYDPVGYIETVQSGNSEGDAIFDTDSGLEGTPMTKVLPGRETEFQVAYGVSDPSDIVMEVDVALFERESLIYVTEQ